MKLLRIRGLHSNAIASKVRPNDARGLFGPALLDHIISDIPKLRPRVRGRNLLFQIDRNSTVGSVVSIPLKGSVILYKL